MDSMKTYNEYKSWFYGTKKKRIANKKSGMPQVKHKKNNAT